MHTKFTKRDYDRFGFGIIQERGYRVESWDFLPVLKTEYYNKYTPHDLSDFKDYKIFKDKDLIISQLNSLSKRDVVIMLIACEDRTEFIYDILNNNNIKYGQVSLGMVPGLWFSLPIRLLLLANNPARLRKGLYVIYKKVFKKKRAKANLKFLIFGGKAALNHVILSKNTDLIRAHAADYDRYLEENMSQSTYHDYPDKYAVYMDEGVSFHPDRIYRNSEQFCSPEHYYPELLKFFEKVEKETGMEIIILACPRVSYKECGNPFGDRTIVHGDTAHAVRNARVVIQHCSTSINFAVLYKKPVIFISSRNYAFQLRLYIKAVANALGQKPVDISKPIKYSFDRFEVKDEYYNKYKETYIKEKNTPESPIWEIFCDYLATMNP